MIKIGDAIILELMYSDRFERYRCKLVEQKDHYIYIDYPINTNTNKTVFLHDGTKFKGSFVAQDGSVYMFETEVLGRVKQNIPMLVLTYPGDSQLIKIQRRQYVRIETDIDIAVHPNNSEFKPFTTITEDVSAGGAAIVTPTSLNLDPGMSITCWIVLSLQNGEYHYIKLDSKVIRTVPINEMKNKVSLQFQEISPQNRQLLLRFCFDRQLLLKKKGLEV